MVTKTLSKGPLGLAQVGGSLKETLTLPMVEPTELPPVLKATKAPITAKTTIRSRTDTVRVFIPFLQGRAHCCNANEEPFSNSGFPERGYRKSCRKLLE